VNRIRAVAAACEASFLDPAVIGKGVCLRISTAHQGANKKKKKQPPVINKPQNQYTENKQRIQSRKSI